MRKLLLAASASIAAMAMTTPASAAITFNLDNVQLIDGSFLTGTFTTSQDLSTLVDFTFNTTAKSSVWGNFAAATYTMADAVGSVFWTSAQGIQANFANPTARVDLFFALPLTQNGADLAVTTSEWVSGVGHRFAVSGSVSPVTQAIPEPATWALMIGGLTLVGVAMRRRKVAVSFA